LIGIDTIQIKANGSVIGSRIGICTNRLINEGVISADRLGCIQYNGIGSPLKNDSDCHRSGASFIGVGGAGWSMTEDKQNELICSQIKGIWHGYREEPWYEGSGGQGTHGGNGGGIIWINALSLSHYGNISS